MRVQNHVEGGKTEWSVLVSSGMKLIFFLVAGKVLFYGFRMRMTLITEVLVTEEQVRME